MLAFLLSCITLPPPPPDQSVALSVLSQVPVVSSNPARGSLRRYLHAFTTLSQQDLHSYMLIVIMMIVKIL